MVFFIGYAAIRLVRLTEITVCTKGVQFSCRCALHLSITPVKVVRRAAIFLLSFLIALAQCVLAIYWVELGQRPIDPLRI
jgi:hypothetical protein